MKKVSPTKRKKKLEMGENLLDVSEINLPALPTSPSEEPTKVGRPPRIRIRGQSFLETIGAKIGTEIMVELIKQAKSGNLQAINIASNLMYSRPSPRNMVSVDLRKFNLNELRGISDACTHILHLVGQSKLSLEEGTKLITIINWKHNMNVTKVEEEVLSFIEVSRGETDTSPPDDPLMTEEEFEASQKTKN